jgi:hypothetical protein
MKSASGLAAFAKQALAANVGYVWGSFGQVCTPEFLAQKERQYPANVGGSYGNIIRHQWMGHRVTDCIGLVKYYLMVDKFGDNPRYIAAYDHGANQHFEEAKEKGSMNSLPEIPGLLLHMDGHVGIYIGGGYAIEARGTAYGVVKTRVKDRPWDHWYKSIFLDYSAHPVTAKPNYTCDTSNGTDHPVIVSRGAAYQALITCDSVPKVVAGTSDVVTILHRYDDGEKRYFWFVPIGHSGQETGIYINGGPRQFVMEIK